MNSYITMIVFLMKKRQFYVFFLSITEYLQYIYTYNKQYENYKEFALRNQTYFITIYLTLNKKRGYRYGGNIKKRLY